MDVDDRLLRWALRGNAAFSLLSGAAAVAWAAALAGWMGAPSPAWLQTLGVNLWAFAGCLLWLAARPRVSLGLAWAVIGADLAWVLGTVPVVASDALTRQGDWLALGVAEIVLLFAVLQALGARRAVAVVDTRQAA